MWTDLLSTPRSSPRSQASDCDRKVFTEAQPEQRRARNVLAITYKDIGRWTICVATGLGNHEIARRLVLSDKTVRNHVSAILFKLQVHDRAAAVAKARNAGLGQPS
jgi:ATP/maltotriose-dependent transcriptional regulator MalT